MGKVLVVDDNHDAADTMSVLLRQWGHTTATAYDGPTALDIAASFGLSLRSEVRGLAC